MRIFEVLNQNPRQPNQSPGFDPNQTGNNPEDDANGKYDDDKVTQNLQQVGQDIDDQNAQPDQPGQQEQQPPELDNSNVKPIDDALLSQIKHLAYTTKYDFDDDSPLNPIKIAEMQVQDLHYLRNQVRYKMDIAGLHNQVGQYDDRLIGYCNDLIKFIDTVVQFKTTNTRAQLAQYNPAPAYQTLARP